MNPCWTNLFERMAATGGVDMERLTPTLLESTFLAEQAVIRCFGPDESNIEAGIAAYLCLLETASPEWKEMALAFVDESLQGSGVLYGLVGELLLRAKGYRVLTISKNPAYWSIVRRYGLYAATQRTMDVKSFAEKVGLTGPGRRNRLPDAALSDSLPRLSNGTRALFVR